jgi:hypothetical protein
LERRVPHTLSRVVVNRIQPVRFFLPRNDFENLVSIGCTVFQKNLKSKQLTAILLNADKSFVAFGEEARAMYCDLPPESQSSFHYFEKPKMRLYVKEEKQRAAKAEGTKAEAEKCLEEKQQLMFNDALDRPHPIGDVLAPILKYLGDTALEQINEGAVSCKISFANILFVVSVPAIWSDGAKQMMRLAAVRAGICDKNATNLVLALESEAASLACYNEGLKSGKFKWYSGLKYMVMDLGGGTADYTVHQVTDKESLGEVCASSGGAWGSTFVDLAFVAFLNSVIRVPQNAQGKQDDFMTLYKRAYPADYIEIMEKFEKVKCQVSMEKSMLTNHQRLPLPGSGTFTAFVQKMTGETFQALINAYFDRVEGVSKDIGVMDKVLGKEKEGPKEGPVADAVQVVKQQTVNESVMAKAATIWQQVKTAVSGIGEKGEKADVSVKDGRAQTFSLLPDNRLLMSKTLLLTFFEPAVAPAIDCARKTIQNVKTLGDKRGISYIFLVGGFAQSNVMRAAVQNMADELAIPLIVPNHCELCVINGAVDYGINPTIIVSRIVKYSYGYMMWWPRWQLRAFEIPFSTVSNKLGTHVNRFTPLCKKGDSIEVGKIVEAECFAADEYITEVTIRLMRTESSAELIFDEDPCLMFCGTVTIPTPTNSSQSSRRITLQCNFGSTEVRFTVTNEKTGVSSGAKMEFATLL